MYLLFKRYQNNTEIPLIYNPMIRSVNNFHLYLTNTRIARQAIVLKKLSDQSLRKNILLRPSL